jgi:hypothetical protein
VSITLTMLRKLTHILMVLAFGAPSVSCFCSQQTAFAEMACGMDKPESCCCETEVQTPASPQDVDAVAPATVEFTGLPVFVSPVPESLVSSGVVRFVSSDHNLLLHAPQTIYLTHQSFLI